MIYSIKKSDNLHIFITGDIDESTSTGIQDLVYGAEFRDDIKTVVIGINSPGGSVLYANDIISSIKKSTKRVVCRIEGVAASSAFLIWLSASKENREMTSQGLGMMHNPNNADEKTLDAFKNSISTFISENSILDKDSVNILMDNTTWLDAEDMAKYGLIENMNIIDAGKKFKFEPFNYLYTLTNKYLTDIFNKKDIEIMEQTEIEKVTEEIVTTETVEEITVEEKVEEVNPLIAENESLKAEISRLSDIVNKIEADKVTAKKEALLVDIEDKAAWMKLDVETIQNLLKSTPTKKVIEGKKVDIEATNIKTLNSVKNLSQLSVDEKIELFNTDKEQYMKLFYNKEIN